MGREFPPEEQGHTDVVLSSYAFWQQSFFWGDRNVQGKTLRLGGKAHTVIGEMNRRS